jgi:molybdopterin converting factor small subunit
MARIKLSLYASFRAAIGGKPSVELEIEPDESIGEVLQRLGVPREQTRIVLVNGRHAALADPLQGGEHVAVFPAIGGGC